MMPAIPSDRPNLPSLAWALLRIGAVAFGGLGATLALLDRDLVKERGWLQSSDIAAALALTKPLPGSTGVQVVTFLSWRLGGWPGAILATIAFILPAFLIMTIAAAAVIALPDTAWVRGALTGLHVGVVGILAGACWRLVQSEAPSAFLRAVLLGALIAGFFVNAAIVVIAAGLLGITVYRVRARV